ncbi:hypothetical protein EMCG_01296 [[Emmonsia] crescens]|uniref:Ribosome biogenesis protein SLX9 n=1 Tax=[Emmonsia] crescens TaxID=73230 RepID=A0A0G2JA38_9EURO|nr:hypothetical protein EMCG_01296 [Emmonsia crescens UAMH 3008]
MAPIAPKKRTSTRAKIARKPTVTTTTSTDPITNPITNPITDPTAGPFTGTSTFRTTKKDKRQIKHSIFLSKIEKPRSKTLKRRRPSKKLVANLDSLVAALPDAGDVNDDNDKKHSQMMNGQVNIIQQKSLKHKPGAMKRKETLDRRERERFARNLAQMAVVSSSSTTVAESSSNNAPAEVVQAENAPTSNRWAALRNFISQTMDQNPEFRNDRPT